MPVKPKTDSQHQVVSRYNTSVITIFIAIVLAAIGIAVYWYAIELSSYKKAQALDLEKQANVLDNKLKQSTDTILGLRQFANYYLEHPQELNATLPSLTQEDTQYYLERKRPLDVNSQKILSANITGIGDIEQFDNKVKQELAMAYSLTPAFITAQNANEEANWFYYVSISRFVSLYPWISRDFWQYTDQMLNNNHMQRIVNSGKADDERYWSPPYVDSAGKGLNTALGMPVFRGEQVVGAVVIDISLAKLHEHITDVLHEDQGVILLDSNNHVLVHETSGENNVKSRVNWYSVAPNELKNLNYDGVKKSDGFMVQDGWLVQYTNLQSNDWILIKYQRYQDYTDPIFSRFIGVFVLLFIGLLILLSIVYLVTRKTFIKPAQQFIEHIEHSARGDHGVVKPPTGWRHWFFLVEQIFTENRSLLQQLKDQNEVLDERVIEKTQALTIKSEQHQHDYAILRSVMDAIPDYIIFNDLHGKLIGCNRAFELFVDRSERDLLGVSAGNLLSNSLGELLDQNHIQLRQADRQNIGLFEVVEVAGKTYEVFSTDCLKDDGKSLGNIDIIRDVTTQYAVNAALANAKDQAEMANKAKSQFLANMSHEIRTPINAIKGMHFLLSSSALSSMQAQHLENAQSASNALLHLVDELLDFAKIESGNMSIVKADTSIDNIVSQAVNLTANMLKNKTIEFTVVIAENVPELIYTDEMRLVQVLTNLLNNAVKFTAKGEISVNISLIETDKEQGSLLYFEVKDTGIGIEKSKQAHLFEAFRQADESMTRKYGGSGLGLSICQQIVNLLGGVISISSKEGVGSTFSFELPIKQTPKSKKLEKLSECKLTVLAENIAPAVVNSLHRLNLTTEILEPNSNNKDDCTYFDKIAFSSKVGNILFVDSHVINKHFCQCLLALNEQNENITWILAIVTNSAFVSSNDDFEYMDVHGINYVLCPVPLFRHSVFKLLDNLEQIQKQPISANKLLSSKTSDDIESELAGINVLLVEDNLVNQLVATELLKTMDVVVSVAEHGKVALDMLEEKDFDVVLMDIQMPVMDGLTATKTIKQQEKYKALPIIAMTAHAREEDKQQSFAVGMDDHIAKPVTADVLKETILSVLNKYKFKS